MIITGLFFFRSLAENQVLSCLNILKVGIFWIFLVSTVSCARVHPAVMIRVIIRSSFFMIYLMCPDSDRDANMQMCKLFLIYELRKWSNIVNVKMFNQFSSAHLKSAHHSSIISICQAMCSAVMGYNAPLRMV